MSIRVKPVDWSLRYTLYVLFILLAAPVSAGVHDDVGFTRLKTELGDRLPTGKSIVVAQVESSVEVEKGKDSGPGILTWMPNTRARSFRSYNISDRSGAPDGVYSGHATAVARRIIGRGTDQGMVSQVAGYEVYSVLHWLGSGMLQGRSGLTPKASPVRVINHSWASGSGNSRILRRADWLTDRDEIIQVVGVRNAQGKVNHPLMAALANAVVVGRSDGKHSVGTTAIDHEYPGARTRPHLVAPLRTGSAAAPTVASAVILLLDMARDPSLSTRQAPVENRGGQQIYDAGRSEVIRAVLMTAADRETDNSSSGNINAYRETGYQSDNGLDIRYGAGQLNVHKAWQILNAGEQEQGSRSCGFDYDPGLSVKAGVRRYVMPEVAVATRISATLSWNLLFPYRNAERFDASAVLNNLDLSLYEISDGVERLVQVSQSRIDTTETIMADLVPGKRYHLIVARADKNLIDQDYAIAWYMGGGEPGQHIGLTSKVSNTLPFQVPGAQIMTNERFF